MNFFKKAALFLTAAVLCFTLASCNDSKTKWALEVNKEQLPAGVYLYYLYAAKSEVIEKANADESYKNKPWEMTIDGKNSKTWAEEKAVQYCLELLATENEFKRMGLSLTGEEKAATEQQVSMYMDYLGESYTKMGISEASLSRVMFQGTYGDKILLATYGEGGEKEVKEEDLISHYKENYVRVKHIFLKTTDENNAELTGDALADVETKANDLLAKAKAAKTEEEFSALVKENTQDPGQNTDETIAKGYIITKEDSGMVKEFEEAAANEAVGSIVLIKSDMGYHIMKKYDPMEDDGKYLLEMKDEVLFHMKKDEYTAYLTTLANGLKEKMTINDAAVARYDVTGLKDYTS